MMEQSHVKSIQFSIATQYYLQEYWFYCFILSLNFLSCYELKRNFTMPLLILGIHFKALNLEWYLVS